MRYVEFKPQRGFIIASDATPLGPMLLKMFVLETDGTIRARNRWKWLRSSQMVIVALGPDRQRLPLNAHGNPRLFFERLEHALKKDVRALEVVL